MTMPQDHCIIILTQFHRRQGKHLFDQIIIVIIIHLLAHIGCPGSNCPQQRSRNKTLDMIECAAAQNFAELLQQQLGIYTRSEWSAVLP